MYFLACRHATPPLPQSLRKSNYSSRRWNCASFLSFLPSDFCENNIQLSWACASGDSVTRAINMFSVHKKTGEMSSKTTSANPRCGLSFLKLQRDRNVTAVRKQPRPLPEIPSLRSSNCQEIKTHNSHRHLWLGFRHSGQQGKSMRSAVRQTYLLTLTSYVTLGKLFASPEPQSPPLQGPAATGTKCQLWDWA